MLVFALRVCYCVTMGEDEGQNVLVGNLRLPGCISDIDPVLSSYLFPFVVSVACAQAQCPYIDC